MVPEKATRIARPDGEKIMATLNSEILFLWDLYCGATVGRRNTDMKSKVDVGEGYRELHLDEELQAGDEWDHDGSWNKTNCMGSKVRDARITPVGLLTYRRKMEVVNPGPGYRLLEVGEHIQEFDEWFKNGKWIQTQFGDNEVIKPTDGCSYRRKVPQGISPGVGYRWVRPGETILPTDECHMGHHARWQKTMRPGEVVESEKIYRRKLTPGYTQSYGGSCGKIPVKPPLGLMPQSIWKENRRDEVRAAIRRYIDANHDVPAEWLRELSELSCGILNP